MRRLTWFGSFFRHRFSLPTRRPLGAIVVGSVLFGLMASSARAWDDIGHEMVARVAWVRLCEPDRRRVLDLLRDAPPGARLASLEPTELRLPPAAGERVFFERAAVWADQARELPEYDRGAWHYVNFFWREAATEGGASENLPWPIREPNILTALRSNAAVFGDSSVPASERALALAWLLHLVGDLHQPLHASARVTETEPRGDRGGNDVALVGVPGEDLHGLWDGILRVRMPRRDGESMAGWMARIGERVDGGDHPRSFCSEAETEADGESLAGAERLTAAVDQWALESLSLAQREAYRVRRGAQPSEADLRLIEVAAIDRLVTAGERLARLIADLLRD